MLMENFRNKIKVGLHSYSIRYVIKDDAEETLEKVN